MKNKDIIEKTFLLAWPYAILFSLVLYMITKNFDDVLSFILGFGASMMVQSMNYRFMKSTFQNEPDKIKGRQVILFLVRYAFMGLILYISYSSEEFNEYLTFVGLLSFVIVAIPTSIIFSRRGVEEDE
ncbi:MAG: ATP synthase subunit I [Candidatus Izemoplasmatales bacterium]|uniref:ATP synthase subunit I n=1 Tax=Hujiaoplasma nucleasis TaxID=2725268 RepID=A0A7L6N449_9MOLU|nr:ATP synthase subunit I [Hujiaoplasma nucleasis]QLY40262.1 hypothetical protein HF295_05070 [Hujiaoplasma nucleasis]